MIFLIEILVFLALMILMDPVWQINLTLHTNLYKFEFKFQRKLTQ